MDRYVMRHPEISIPALIPESSLRAHKGRGWLRVSDAIAEHDMDRVDLAEYTDAPDLDAQPAGLPATAPATEPRAGKPDKASKEN